jgi:hypothetical protein
MKNIIIVLVIVLVALIAWQTYGCGSSVNKAIAGYIEKEIASPAKDNPNSKYFVSGMEHKITKKTRQESDDPTRKIYAVEIEFDYKDKATAPSEGPEGKKIKNAIFTLTVVNDTFNKNITISDFRGKTGVRPQYWD